MTFFESKGVEFQMSANTIEQADRMFNYSCQICCNRGLRIDCDRCAICCVHDQVCAAMDDEKIDQAVRSAYKRSFLSMLRQVS